MYTHRYFDRIEFDNLWESLKANGHTNKRFFEDFHLQQLQAIDDDFDQQEAQCEHGSDEEGVYS